MLYLPLDFFTINFQFLNFEIENAQAGVAQLVEHDLAKVGVAGPSPVSRSVRRMLFVKRYWLFG